MIIKKFRGISEAEEICLCPGHGIFNLFCFFFPLPSEEKHIWHC